MCHRGMSFFRQDRGRAFNIEDEFHLKTEKSRNVPEQVKKDAPMTTDQGAVNYVHCVASPLINQASVSETW